MVASVDKGLLSLNGGLGLCTGDVGNMKIDIIKQWTDGKIASC
jgi:hypothetical protein